MQEDLLIHIIMAFYCDPHQTKHQNKQKVTLYIITAKVKSL